MALQNENRGAFIRDLISVEDLCRGLDPRRPEDLALIEYLRIEQDKTLIDQDDLLRFFQDHPDLCFRLAEILSRLYQNALKTIRSH